MISVIIARTMLTASRKLKHFSIVLIAIPTLFKSDRALIELIVSARCRWSKLIPNTIAWKCRITLIVTKQRGFGLDWRLISVGLSRSTSTVKTFLRLSRPVGRGVVILERQVVLVLLTHLYISCHLLSRWWCTLIELTSLVIVVLRVHWLLLFLWLQLLRIVIIESFAVSS